MIKSLRTSSKSLLAFLAIALLFSGCAQWKDVTGSQNIKSQKLSIDLKEDNWHAFDNANFESYSLTKDGLLLQQITIKRFELDEVLSNKKKISKDILPHELAELLIEDIKARNSMKAFKMISNEPDIIAQQDGINLIFEQKDDFNNVIRKNASYFIYDEKLYMIIYIAPVQHYYKKDLHKFQAIKKSIKIQS
jgi:PBP1b-binding outer membrane lipoprotein LpoB